MNRFGIQFHNHHISFAHFQGGLNSSLQARVVRFNRKTINYQFNVVHFVAIEFHLFRHLLQLAVDSRANISLLHERIEEFAVVTFSCFHQRRKNGYFFRLEILRYFFNELLFGESHHFLSGCRTVRV